MPLLTIQNAEGNGVIYQVDTSTEAVGVGGMGQVFKGLRIDTQTGVKQEVAIKFLFDDLPPQSIERARREAGIRISNENLVRMYDFIETAETLPNGNTVAHYHVVSEFLRGVMLEDLMKGKVDDADGHRIPYAEELYLQFKQQPELFAVQIIKNVLAGVMALHDQGIIHRDIDPSNIMITTEGKIKLIDYGIAKRLNDLNTKDRQLTSAGAFMGKAAYAAPELVLGDVIHQNETTDIYAIGVILFQLLTGHLPFSGPSSEVLDKQLNAPVPVKDIKDGRFRKIVAKAMAKKQVDRYSSASEFRVALEVIYRKLVPRILVETEDENNLPASDQSIISKKAVMWVAIACFVLLLGGGSYFLWKRSRDNRMALEAKEQLQKAIELRTKELSGAMLDSVDPDISRQDTLTQIVIHSTGYYTQEAIKMLQDSSSAHDGVALLEKVMAKEYPSSANAYAIMASLFSKSGAFEVLHLFNFYQGTDFQKAFELNQKAIQLDSTCYYALFDMGMTYISASRNVVKRETEKGLEMLRSSHDYSVLNEDESFASYVDSQMN